MKLAKISPHLWFAEDAEAAVRFYAGIFPDARVDRVTTSPPDTPSGPAGSVKMIDFTLCGQSFLAIEAGTLDPFNHAISLVVSCTDQAEVDHYWNALAAGGRTEECGWLRDRYGVSWQVVPAVLRDMLSDRDRTRAKRVMEAMMKMGKLEIAELRRAHERS